MSVRAILETVVYVDNFRNIDLFAQGFYQLRLRVGYDYNEDCVRSGLTFKQVLASPFSSYLAENSKSRQNTEVAVKTTGGRFWSSRFHRLHKPQVEEASNTYKSHLFYVRFSEETVI